MKDLDIEVKRSSLMRNIFLGSSILLMSGSVLIIGYLFKNKFSDKKELAVKSENIIKPSNHLEEKNNALKDENDLSKVPENELGVVTSKLGFSMKYSPENVKVVFNTLEVFQSVFVVDFGSAGVGKEASGQLNSDMDDLNFQGLFLTAIEVDSNTEFGTWIQDYLADLKDERNSEKVLSENITEENFLDLKAYYVLSSVQGPDSQNNPHYSRKEFLIKKDNYVYHFSYLAPAPDTNFIRSREAGKKYLEYVDAVSEEMIKTFRFDSSTVTANILPKYAFKPSDDKKEEFDNILDNLRQGPFFDTTKKYSKISSQDRCAIKNNNIQNDNYKGENYLQSSPGVFFSISPESAEINAYDEEGNHTGKVSGFEESEVIEELAVGFDSINLFMEGYGIGMRENLSGRIEIVGKAFGYANFEISGDGNQCIVSEMFIPVTPYLICKLPITISGDFGPFSCDIDGDGSEDYLYSLIYPPLEQKKKEIESIMGIMMQNN
ncbi:MAG: hypothetical protein ACD_7C00278G0004 [uncultured bacterium]|nr:MAG: hypothetical protein ACD_7C00278G0004 [uncultured bacterium]HBR78894.1 hypothetical protein [Candidatus Moranbacteria bacterium]